MVTTEISISPPLSIWEKGKKIQNEDFIYPSPPNLSANDTLFLVFDGIGGLPNGSEAARLACKKWVEFYELNQKPKLNPRLIKETVLFVQQAFDAYILRYPEAKEMGTTLALLQIQDAGAAIAYIGDSRIYHIRAGQILFVSRDHSYVNELIEKKMIRPEDAATHPERKTITQAIQASNIRTVTPSYAFIEDIKSEDYFFLCTDGILEGVKEWELLEILSGAYNNNGYKIEEIRRLCNNYATDNFSAFLIQVK